VPDEGLPVPRPGEEMSAYVEPSAWANAFFVIAYKLPVLGLPLCDECGGPCEDAEYEAAIATVASKN